MSGLSVSLKDNPRLEQWLRFEGDRTVRIATGKVEMGQGILTALAQIAAEELDVDVEQVRILSGNTAEGPGEGYTASSWSIEHSGAAIRQVAAEVRAMAVHQAALRLGADTAALSLDRGQILLRGMPSGLDYWNLAAELDLGVEVTGKAQPKPSATHRTVGTSTQRIDLPVKLCGGGFIQDMAPTGMLHARILRQPARGACLVSLDEAAIRRKAGSAIEIVRVAHFVAFVGSDEPTVRAALKAANAVAVWDNVPTLTLAQSPADWIAAQPSHDRVFGPGFTRSAQERISARSTRPFLSHGSIAPSCALALFHDGLLTVWSHAQGMHPLRDNIAKTLGLPVEQVSCHHVHGAGCYGHNGADDAALDAAIVAMQMPGRAIRVSWERADEFGHEPLSSAMAVTVHAVLGDDGLPVDWTTEIWSAAHGQRPGVGGAYLLAADALPEPPPQRKPFDIPEERGGGATRNGLPLYDIAAKRIDFHLVHDIPLRTSSLRGLGATLNIFSIEGLIDDLALRANKDPLAYRLAMLTDPRARQVLEKAASMANWSRRCEGGDGKGLGLGIARYKNSSAYAAVVAEIEVQEAVRVKRVWCAVDAGLVINPDGVTNQVEGNIVQAISWTLIEEVRLGAHGVESLDWETYPVIRFSDVPPIEVELMRNTAHAPLGVGECAGGPTAAAIGNAVAHALGKRMHDMPLSRERILASLIA
ncbi:molybdopterin cofactor-binding domain-containing protein [Hydrogenophaga sp.]|uniref:molybdopterin cofactor-binding domain-containing protein n=1 Tax=Hydrogenophaga sp. TaxID=1904254 RepID=UPI00271FE4BC|nr:molybdopterin cofactor-binding domain-containing protein [Hydrogenophaga sp.]MDO9437084.1 molybdopterin-dependent oxidoreductase [Hydrogenophaga sp.]